MRLPRLGFTVRGMMFAAAAGMISGFTAPSQADDPPGREDLGPDVRVYREPEDPMARLRAKSWALLASGKKLKNEEVLRVLDDLDRVIAVRPADPMPRWTRGLALTRLKRPADARAARDEAIRLARSWPGGEDMLPALYGEHARACVDEGDIPAAAAAFLAVLDIDEGGKRWFEDLAEAAAAPPKGPRFAPGPGPLFPGAAAAEKDWGPLAKFFETHAGPAHAASLARVAERVSVGMDYRKVACVAGFPGPSPCDWDHGVPDRDDCWGYQIERATIRRDGDFVVAVPPANPATLHVVIRDGRVCKVETTRGHAPERDKVVHPHGERQSIPYERNGIYSVAFSPDGSLVAAGDQRGGIHLREARTGRPRTTLRIPGVDEENAFGSFKCVAFAPGGKILAGAGLYDKAARLWDVESGRIFATLKAVPGPVEPGAMDRVESIAFSPDGKTLATAGYSPEVRLWDVATGRLLASLQGHPENAKAVAFSPDGKTLASGGEDGRVVLWDVAACRPRSRIPGYEIAVCGLAFSPDGRTLAVARGDGDSGRVQLRDVATGGCRATLRVCFTYRIDLAFSPDGRTLAVADGSWRVATLWDVASGRKSGLLEGHDGGMDDVECVAFSPDGKSLATGGYGLKLWDTPAPAPVKEAAR